VGFASAIIASAISIAMGTAAGFLGGAVDRLLNGIILIFQNLPSFPVLIIAATFWREMPLLVVSILIGLFEWTGGARRIRAQALSLRGRDFTTALRTIGESKARIVFGEGRTPLFGLLCPILLHLL